MSEKWRTKGDSDRVEESKQRGGAGQSNAVDSAHVPYLTTRNTRLNLAKLYLLRSDPPCKQ
jgi:hypothetical protein